MDRVLTKGASRRPSHGARGLLNHIGSFAELVAEQRYRLQFLREDGWQRTLLMVAIALGYATSAPNDFVFFDGRPGLFALAYTLSGRVFSASSRKALLKGADGVCFIGDSRLERMEANIEALDSLSRNLIEYGVDPNRLPRVVQYNKRDQPSAVQLTVLAQTLNPTNVPSYEAVASSGVGVFDTLKGITKLVLAVLQQPA